MEQATVDVAIHDPVSSQSILVKSVVNALLFKKMTNLSGWRVSPHHLARSEGLLYVSIPSAPCYGTSRKYSVAGLFL